MYPPCFAGATTLQPQTVSDSLFWACHISDVSSRPGRASGIVDGLTLQHVTLNRAKRSTLPFLGGILEKENLQVASTRLIGYRTFSLKSNCRRTASADKPPLRRVVMTFSCRLAESWCQRYASTSSTWARSSWIISASVWYRAMRVAKEKDARNGSVELLKLDWFMKAVNILSKGNLSGSCLAALVALEFSKVSKYLGHKFVIFAVAFFIARSACGRTRTSKWRQCSPSRQGNTLTLIECKVLKTFYLYIYLSYLYILIFIHLFIYYFFWLSLSLCLKSNYVEKRVLTQELRQWVYLALVDHTYKEVAMMSAHCTKFLEHPGIACPNASPAK